ncbi:MAG: hypothetical protein KatS3mg124_2481 [Porticoccaceae bacterium]|nr:MAG: hypothetical protein KatS3mg124_2481 [Porticoccaceae bacterium]
MDIALAGAAAMLLVTGVLTPEETFLGFANPALWVIVCFYVVSAAMKESGALTWWIQRLLGHGGDLRGVLTRLIAAVAAASSLIANTPVVAIFIPQVQDWARRHRVASSQLLLPLSYAAIVGGTLSLIGTSTNLLLVGLMQGRPELEALSLFSPAQVGIPLVVLLAAYFALVGRRLLPDRDGVSDVVADARQYAVPMEVDPDGVLAGKTIAEAGLRHLRYSFLSEIQSGGRVIPAVGPRRGDPRRRHPGVRRPARGGQRTAPASRASSPPSATSSSWTSP